VVATRVVFCFRFLMLIFEMWVSEGSAPYMRDRAAHGRSLSKEGQRLFRGCFRKTGVATFSHMGQRVRLICRVSSRSVLETFERGGPSTDMSTRRHHCKSPWSGPGPCRLCCFLGSFSRSYEDFFCIFIDMGGAPYDGDVEGHVYFCLGPGLTPGYSSS
jgi:hypothetical protein